MEQENQWSGMAYEGPNTLAEDMSPTEMLQRLDRLLEQSYRPPRTMEELMHDPFMLAVVCAAALIFAGTIIVVRFFKRKPLSRKQTEVARPPEIHVPVRVPVSEPPKATESVNTDVDLDEFMNRLFGSGVVVRRHKPDGVVKVRCIKLNDQCDLCIFKQFKKRNSVAQPTGGPYMKLPLKDMKDCFDCDGAFPPSFIVEFKTKILQLSAEYSLDNTYLIQGFKGVCRKMKQDPQFLTTWSERFAQRLQTAKNLRSRVDNGKKSSFFLFSSPNKSAMGDDDDLRSVTTVNTVVSR